MATKRKYRCSDCGFQFEYTHVEKSEPLLTDCPNIDCASNAVAHDVEAERLEGEERIRRMVDSGIPPAMSTNKSVALKHAERAMESMGLTNANDGGRPGDRAAPTPTPPGTAEIEAMTRQAVEAKAITQQEATQFAEGARTFWQGGKQAPPGAARPPKLQQHINQAAPSAAVARQQGVDPIKLLHDGEKRTGGIKYDVVARAKA